MLRTDVLGNPGGPLKRAYTVNNTVGTLATLAATATKPTGEGVVNFASSAPERIVVFPFGAGADNATGTVRVVGWRRVGSLWVPGILLQFTVTLSAFVGVAGQPVINTERFADTVSAPVANFGITNVNCFLYSPQNDTPGYYVLLGAGCGLVRIDTAIGTATAMNALVGAG